MNFDLILEMIRYSKELNQKYNKKLEYTIVTNLIALTDEKLQALIDNNVSICTSLDGCEIVHNHNRKLRSGEGTYQHVKKAIQHVRSAGKEVGAIETTTRFSLQYPVEIVDEYVSTGLSGIFLRPLTPLGFAKSFWDEVGYSAEEFIEFYKKAFAHILEVNKQGTYFPELHATYFLRKMLHGDADNYMELRSPCGAGIGQMSYYYNGNVYTCDEGRMMGEAGDNTFLLGNVHKNSYDDMVGKKTSVLPAPHPSWNLYPSAAIVHTIRIAAYALLSHIPAMEIFSPENRLILDVKSIKALWIFFSTFCRRMNRRSCTYYIVGLRNSHEEIRYIFCCILRGICSSIRLYILSGKSGGQTI